MVEKEGVVVFSSFFNRNIPIEEISSFCINPHILLDWYYKSELIVHDDTEIITLGQALETDFNVFALVDGCPRKWYPVIVKIGEKKNE